MELEGLEFSGSGLITDPETNVQDRLTVHAQLDLAQIVLSPEQQLTDDGYLHPKIEVADVALQLKSDLISITAVGDLPLYKSHKFEEGVKKWMIE